MSLTNDAILNQVIAKAVESRDYGALWGLLIDKKTSQDAKETVFKQLVELYPALEDSKELLKIAEGYKGAISQYTRYLKTRPTTNTYQGASADRANQSARESLKLAMEKRACLTKEMREVAGLKYLDGKLIHIRSYLERKDFTGHKSLLKDVLDLEEDVIGNKSIPREVRKHLKAQLPELAIDVIESAIAKGDYEPVLELNADKLGLFARFFDPYYSATRIAKENVDTVLRNKVEASIASGYWNGLVQIFKLGETSALLKSYIQSKISDTVLTYVSDRIEYFQNNPCSGGFNSIIELISRELGQPVKVDGKSIRLLEFNDTIKPEIANLLVNHLEKVLALDSSVQDKSASICMAVNICVTGLHALGDAYVSKHKERIINMLEVAHTNPTETRKGDVCRILNEWKNESEKRGSRGMHYIDQPIHAPDSIYHLAANALERIRTMDKANPLKQPNGPTNGLKQRV